jgi:putative Mg2+ transporter-C (MgtC) family protein
MPLTLSWHDILIRVALTVLAGFLIGTDRGEHRRPAGLRTTLLVCLAASLAMIQVNLLLGMAGKPPNSFVQLDLMRLPLGILSGMGFIGAGAILHRNDLVMGVTTAATLWFVTVIGLCFGEGQIGLGLTGLVLGLIILRSLKWVEKQLQRDRRASLVIVTDSFGVSERDISSVVSAGGCKIVSSSVALLAPPRQSKFRFEVSWRGHHKHPETPSFVMELAQRPDIQRVVWRPVSS